MFALLLGVANAWADNKLVVKDAFAPQTGKATLAIEAVIEKDNFVGYQFDVTLPNELPLELNDEGKVVATSYTKLDIDGKVLETTSTSTTYRLLASKMGNPTIPIGSYTLLSVTFDTDGSLDVDDVFACSITGVTFSDNNNQGTDFADVNFNVTITDRVVLDENSTVAPAVQTGVNVLVKRSIKAGQWSTIVLPFTLTKAKAEAIFGSDVQLAEFNGFVVDYGTDDTNVTPLGITINLKSYTIPSRGGWAGGKPLLIKVSSDIESFNVDGVNITDKVNDVSKADEYETPGKLTGSFVKTTIPADGLFISDNQFWYSTGKTTVKAFRCWFELGAVLNKETAFPARVSLNFEDETTSIENIDHSPLNIEQSVYDLQGRRVTNPGNGLYIKNNKKVIIK